MNPPKPESTLSSINSFDYNQLSFKQSRFLTSFHHMSSISIKKDTSKFTNPILIRKTINQIMQIVFQLARNTHYGLRSWFRGLTPYFVKTTVPYAMSHTTEDVFNLRSINNSKLSNDQIIQITKAIILAASYTFIYPFDNIRLRMGADVERARVYKNFRDCMEKMKKVQGKSSFFKGYTLSLPYFLLSYFSAVHLYKYLLQKQNNQQLPSILTTSTGFSLFFISYVTAETLLYPLDSIRKNLQINGALNHNNVYDKIRNVLKFNGFLKLYKGLNYKLFEGILYSTIVIGLEKSRELRN